MTPPTAPPSALHGSDDIEDGLSVAHRGSEPPLGRTLHRLGRTTSGESEPPPHRISSLLPPIVIVPLRGSLSPPRGARSRDPSVSPHASSQTSPHASPAAAAAARSRSRDQSLSPRAGHISPHVSPHVSPAAAAAAVRGTTGSPHVSPAAAAARAARERSGGWDRSPQQAFATQGVTGVHFEHVSNPVRRDRADDYVSPQPQPGAHQLGEAALTVERGTPPLGPTAAPQWDEFPELAI